MKTRVLALASALLLGALVGAGGCADNRASVQLQAVCSPPKTCSFTGKCDAQYIWYYAFDRAVAATRTTPALKNILTVFVQAENQVLSNADPGTGRVDTNGAHIDEIVVDLEGAISGTQEIGTTDFIASGTTGVVTVQIAIPATGNGEVLARIRMRGFYDNGSRFETGDLPITFGVCASGCAPDACAGATCPPDAEGQLPLSCAQ